MVMTKRVVESVPRTHHRAAGQLFPFKPLPSALQDAFAVVTMFRRIVFSICSIWLLPVLVASEAIALQPFLVAGVPSGLRKSEPSRLCTRPSIATGGTLALAVVARLIEAVVSTPAGLME